MNKRDKNNKETPLFQIKRLGLGPWVYLYDFLFTIVFFLYLPFYFLRRKITFAALKDRLGFFSFSSLEDVIWMHAVSVGEVNLIEPLLKRLKETLRSQIVVSTTTLTGWQVAQSKYSKIAQVIFSPLDLSFVVKRFISRLNPKAVIAAETELWPNLIRYLDKNQVPFLIVNGRISKKAFNRYCLVRPLIRDVLRCCRHIGAQSQRDKERFLYLGANPEKISVTGNLKFNLSEPDSEKLDAYKKKYYPFLKPKGKLFFIAASTHHPEEEIILDLYGQIFLKNNLTLLIAPRHPGRAASLQRQILARGFNPILLSKLTQKREAEAKDIFILDTVGQLFYLYSLADICFVGGSFSESGGHNILEPMYFLKPVIFGPNMENFAEISRVALKYSAAIQVHSVKQLRQELIGLLESGKKRASYSKSCINVFKDSSGLEKNFQTIIEKINV